MKCEWSLNFLTSLLKLLCFITDLNFHPMNNLSDYPTMRVVQGLTVDCKFYHRNDSHLLCDSFVTMTTPKSVNGTEYELQAWTSVILFLAAPKLLEMFFTHYRNFVSFHYFNAEPFFGIFLTRPAEFLQHYSVTQIGTDRRIQAQTGTCRHRQAHTATDRHR